MKAIIMKSHKKFLCIFLTCIMLITSVPFTNIFSLQADATTEKTEDWLATAMFYDYIGKNFKLFNTKAFPSNINKADALSALIEDLDNDGEKDLVIFSPQKLSLYKIKDGKITFCNSITDEFASFYNGEGHVCIKYSDNVIRIYTSALSAMGSVIVDTWLGFTVKNEKLVKSTSYRSAFSRGHLLYCDDIKNVTYSSEKSLMKDVEKAGFETGEPFHNDYNEKTDPSDFNGFKGNHILTYSEFAYGGTNNGYIYDNTHLKENVTFGILASHPEMNYTVGEDILIGAYHSENDIVDKTTKYSISVSNSSIIEFIKNQVNDGITSFLFKAKYPGSVLVTVKELNSGISRVIKVTVSDNKSAVRCEDITSSKYTKGDGIYIDNVKCKDINNKTHTVTLDAYNFYHTYGIIEVYDEYGNFVSSEVIEPRVQNSGAKLFVESLSCIGYDIFHRDEAFYHDPDSFAKTSITLKNIPNGSKIEYTNNSSLSERLAYYNAVDIFITCLLETLTFSVDVQAQKKTVKAFAKDFLEALSDSAFKDLSSSISKSLTLGSTEKAVKSVYEAILNTCAKIGFDADNYLKNTLSGLGYTAVDSLIEIAVPSWKIAGTILSAVAITYKFVDIDWCKEHKTFYFYASHHGKKTTQLVSNGVIAENETDGFTKEVFHVEIYDGDITIDLDSGEIQNTVPYEIDMYTDGEKKDPENSVEVLIPIPEDFDKDNCGVLRQEENGNFTLLESEIKGDYIAFETDHFSLYILFEAKDIDQIKLTQKITKGDIDCDGRITAADARLALRASVGLEKFSEAQTLAADVDNNKSVTAADARTILRVSVGLEKL